MALSTVQQHYPYRKSLLINVLSETYGDIERFKGFARASADFATTVWAGSPTKMLCEIYAPGIGAPYFEMFASAQRSPTV
jgi:hypothetical protein